MSKPTPIYLDHGASTPVHQAVLEAMAPYWQEVYGNASSTHAFGRQSSRALEEARRRIARLLHASASEVIFTGCGSDSDNLAIRGVLAASRQKGTGNHLIISSIEHSAVLNTAVQLRDLYGYEVTILPVDGYGRVSPEELLSAIRPDTALISIMAANNEIGTLQPIRQIGEIARSHGVIFHTDAIQAVGVQAWQMDDMPVDLLSIAPHKFYGPKGVGILYARSGVDLISPFTGGGQEEGRRAGTSNVAFAVGAAEALELAVTQLDSRNNHYRQLRDKIIVGVQAAFPEKCRLTGHPIDRLPHNASFAFHGLSGNDLLIHLDVAGFAVSSGSACKSGDPKPSRVLEAIGLGPEWTKGGLRITVGEQNQPEDIDAFLHVLPDTVQKIRQVTPAF